MGNRNSRWMALGLGVGGGGVTVELPPDDAIVMEVASTSATWSPQTVTKTGGTLTWYVADSDDNLLTQQTANEPTFDLSGFSGTKTIYVVSPDGWGGLTALTVTSLGIDSIDLSVATALTFLNVSGSNNDLTELDLSALTALITLQATHKQELSTLDISANKLLLTVDVRAGGFTATALDNLITTLDSHGRSNGFLRYESNPGSPTSASHDAYNNLIARGWSITGDAPPAP